MCIPQLTGRLLAVLHGAFNYLQLVYEYWAYNFLDDQIKITYAVSWLKGTAFCWYEPNLDFPDDELSDHAIYWGAFEEALKGNVQRTRSRHLGYH